MNSSNSNSSTLNLKRTQSLSNSPHPSRINKKKKLTHGTSSILSNSSDAEGELELELELELEEPEENVTEHADLDTVKVIQTVKIDKRLTSSPTDANLNDMSMSSPLHPQQLSSDDDYANGTVLCYKCGNRVTFRDESGALTVELWNIHKAKCHVQQRTQSELVTSPPIHPHDSLLHSSSAADLNRDTTTQTQTSQSIPSRVDTLAQSNSQSQSTITMFPQSHNHSHLQKHQQQQPEEAHTLTLTSSPNSNATYATTKKRRAKRTEQERIDYLRSDEYVAQFEAYRVLCGSCNKWIRLRPNSTYCSIPWDAHRKSCLKKVKGAGSVGVGAVKGNTKTQTQTQTRSQSQSQSQTQTQSLIRYKPPTSSPASSSFNNHINNINDLNHPLQTDIYVEKIDLSQFQNNQSRSRIYSSSSSLSGSSLSLASCIRVLCGICDEWISLPRCLDGDGDGDGDDDDANGNGNGSVDANANAISNKYKDKNKDKDEDMMRAWVRHREECLSRYRKANVDADGYNNISWRGNEDEDEDEGGGGGGVSGQAKDSDRDSDVVLRSTSKSQSLSQTQTQTQSRFKRNADAIFTNANTNIGNTKSQSSRLMYLEISPHPSLTRMPSSPISSRSKFKDVARTGRGYRDGHGHGYGHGHEYGGHVSFQPDRDHGHIHPNHSSHPSLRVSLSPTGIPTSIISPRTAQPLSLLSPLSTPTLIPNPAPASEVESENDDEDDDGDKDYVEEEDEEDGNENENDMDMDMDAEMDVNPESMHRRQIIRRDSGSNVNANTNVNNGSSTDTNGMLLTREMRNGLGRASTSVRRRYVNNEDDNTSSSSKRRFFVLSQLKSDEMHRRDGIGYRYNRTNSSDRTVSAGSRIGNDLDASSPRSSLVTQARASKNVIGKGSHGGRSGGGSAMTMSMLNSPVALGLADLDSSFGRTTFISNSITHLFNTTYEKTDDMTISSLLTYLNAAMPVDKHEDFDYKEVRDALGVLEREWRVVRVVRVGGGERESMEGSGVGGDESMEVVRLLR